MTERLTPEEVDKKIAEIKQSIKTRTLKKAFVQESVYTDEQIQQHKSKKAKSRKKSKLQKSSRKRNRG